MGEQDKVEVDEKENSADLKSPSTSFVKSVASKASVRSKSGSQASLKGETEENISVQKNPSKTSVKSVASKTSVRSKSGSRTSLKNEGNIATEVKLYESSL